MKKFGACYLVQKSASDRWSVDRYYSVNNTKEAFIEEFRDYLVKHYRATSIKVHAPLIKMMAMLVDLPDIRNIDSEIFIELNNSVKIVLFDIQDGIEISQKELNVNLDNLFSVAICTRQLQPDNINRLPDEDSLLRNPLIKNTVENSELHKYVVPLEMVGYYYDKDVWLQIRDTYYKTRKENV